MAFLHHHFFTFQVSIEYGLCEMLNRVAIRAAAAPKDGDFKFSISQYESELPAGTVDNTVEPVYRKVFCRI